MAYYSEQINYTLTDAARVSIITAYSTRPCVQLYLGNDLIDSAVPAGSGVTFWIRRPKIGEYIRLLAVDVADAEVDYFSQAFPNDAGKRPRIITPKALGYRRGDEWRVYLEDARVYKRDIFPGATDNGGFALADMGTDGFGWPGPATGGMGDYFGYAAFGFDPYRMEYKSPVKASGDYEFAATVLDSADNETSQFEADVVHDTFPAEPASLIAATYVAVTGALALTLTESEDL